VVVVVVVVVMYHDEQGTWSLLAMGVIAAFACVYRAVEIGMLQGPMSRWGRDCLECALSTLEAQVRTARAATGGGVGRTCVVCYVCEWRVGQRSGGVCGRGVCFVCRPGAMPNRAHGNRYSVC